MKEIRSEQYSAQNEFCFCLKSLLLCVTILVTWRMNSELLGIHLNKCDFVSVLLVA